MGMYTEVLVKADIKAISAQNKAALRFLFGDGDTALLDVLGLPDHPFFKSERWNSIGRSSSYYHIPKALNFFDGSYLFSRSDMKSYNGEAELFFDWLIKHCADVEHGECVGYIWYETWDKPKLVCGGDDLLGSE